MCKRQFGSDDKLLVSKIINCRQNTAILRVTATGVILALCVIQCDTALTFVEVLTTLSLSVEMNRSTSVVG